MFLTIKHKTADGREEVFLVASVTFDPALNELVGKGAPGPDEGTRVNGVVRYTSGRAYVMNDNGKTVATYDLK